MLAMTEPSNIHPGAGRRKAVPFPKGRVLDEDDARAIAALLADRPRRRDLLIDHLHLIQDHYSCLTAGHLQALAGEMKLSMAEIYEVATFYAHFDVVPDGGAKPAPITVRICDSLSCMLAGSEALYDALKSKDKELGAVRILKAPCMGACDRAPACQIGTAAIAPATLDNIEAHLTCLAADPGRRNNHSAPSQPELPICQSLEAYQDNERGYQQLRACLAGEMSREDVMARLSDSALHGAGGAGFPTGRKWQLVRAAKAPRLMAVNGDEGEPGTFKDRYYLERHPHQILEGILIAAWVIEAEEVYIYIRDEYPAALQILRNEIAALETEGQLNAHTNLILRRGAGAYICGEESAMIESIEGKRGLPRHRPPYVAEVGLFGCPTLVNNIETLYWVPQILARGADWFAAQGINGAKGLRSYSVSGRVRNPGVKLLPAGSTALDLIEASDGMVDGHRFKAYLPGGASGGILPASKADIPLDFGQLEKYGCFVGSHAVIILSDRDNMKDVALNLMRFFEHESCGQCTPCRVGTQKAAALMAQPHWNESLLRELAQVMADASICGLGQAAPNPLLSLLNYFPEDLT